MTVILIGRVVFGIVVRVAAGRLARMEPRLLVSRMDDRMEVKVVARIVSMA